MDVKQHEGQWERRSVRWSAHEHGGLQPAVSERFISAAGVDCHSSNAGITLAERKRRFIKSNEPSEIIRHLEMSSCLLIPPICDSTLIIRLMHRRTAPSGFSQQNQWHNGWTPSQHSQFWDTCTLFPFHATLYFYSTTFVLTAEAAIISRMYLKVYSAVKCFLSMLLHLMFSIPAARNPMQCCNFIL